MTEATERIKKLYGPPASNEQIKLYFETLLGTYIEAAEKHLVETRSKFKWYSNRPLKFLFYANPTTVCFSLIGNADKEGAEEVKDVSLFSSSLKNGTSYFTSGTSLNGQKLYSIESAIREALSRLNREVNESKFPAIQENIKVTGKELEKDEPDLHKIRKSYDSLCQSIRDIEEFKKKTKENKLGDSTFSFGWKSDTCPFLDAYIKRIENIENELKLFEQKSSNITERLNNQYDLSKDAINLLKDERTSKESKHVNRWVIIGIIFSIIIGLIGIILTLDFNSI